MKKSKRVVLVILCMVLIVFLIPQVAFAGFFDKIKDAAKDAADPRDMYDTEDAVDSSEMYDAADAISFPGASDWAVPELEEAYQEGLITEEVMGNYHASITRAEFAGLIVKLYEALTGINANVAGSDTFTDTQDVDVLKAYQLNLVSGMGDGTFAPNNLITREQMAVMYYNTITAAFQKNKQSMPVVDGMLTIQDRNKVSGWADKQVDFVFDEGIIKGNGVNFNPQGNASREAAIAVVKRVYKKYEGGKKYKSSKGYINEEVHGTYIDYDKYSVVAFPWQYNGVNRNKLTGKKYYGGGKGTKKYFTILGQVESLTLVKTFSSPFSGPDGGLENQKVLLGDGKFKDVTMEIEYDDVAGVEVRVNIFIECDVRNSSGGLETIRIYPSYKDQGDKKDPILVK